MSDAIGSQTGAGGGGDGGGRPGAELTPLARQLLAATAVAYAVTGIPLFVAPGWSSEHFAWRVSPFVAMTAGGWCIGTAAFAALAVRARQWSAVRAGVLYPLAFGLTQLGVALYEGDKLRTGEILTWPYLAALGLSIVAGSVALWTGREHVVGPGAVGERARGREVTGLLRVLMVGFCALVFFLAAVAFAAPPKALGGAVFPEPLSLFSLRAFGVFYLSLGLAMLALVADRGADAFLFYMRAGLVLVVAILAATAAYAARFDLGEHPYQVVYPLAYVVALVGATGSLAWDRRGALLSGRRPGATRPGASAGPGPGAVEPVG